MYRVIRPLLFLLPAELAHGFATGLLRAAVGFGPLGRALARRYRETAPEFSQDVWGCRFHNPVGLAAGFDKGAELHRAMSALGFGFVEVGTVTARPQAGNPRPRLFRLRADEALINRMGFNNPGAAAVAQRLARHPPTGPLGINLGRSRAVTNDQAIEDYSQALEALWSYASYLVVNVSSPNTPELRALQARERLGPLVRALRGRLVELAAAAQRQPPPLLLKIAPDLDDAELDGICEVVLAERLDGVIATNTTLSRASLMTPAAHIARAGEGGLSGRPLAERMIDCVGALYRRLGPSVPIVAAGGINGDETAWRAIAAGARLIQVYTALIYQGPGLIRAINRGLLTRLRRLGATRLADVVGQGVELSKGD